MQYIRDHWQGRHSLFWSFWVNLALLRFAILQAEKYTHPPFVENSVLAVIATGVFFILFHLGVYVWQIRGLIKASDRYVSEYGSPIISMASHFGIVVSLLFTGLAVHGSYQTLFTIDRSVAANRLPWNHNLLRDYTLKIEGHNIHLEGDLRIGITEALEKLLLEHPEVTGVNLHSDGGRVMEGRALAQLFRSRNLNTYVTKDCKSACTTAFIGGKIRMLGSRGRLGFHQFSLDGVYNNPYIDPKSEQKIDLVFYEAQGISRTFLDDVFQAAHEEMWFPAPAYLLTSGVVHKILAEPVIQN